VRESESESVFVFVFEGGQRERVAWAERDGIMWGQQADGETSPPGV